ncbi:Integrase, catalytic core [Cucumis melo var. makuwa]|uniref:Integrase, catalytic core n=1 Tax=Cucumis melo var. makuwa TaxID=1194695 RepID=A0A5A7VDL7_CUCMM|nr:Integrase, catalytic core [Cucumis melo var. makuwa]TYK13772.1 Integrase, catalytic core [Cucumis melo var. makuwa]
MSEAIVSVGKLGSLIAHFQAQPTLINHIIQAQQEDTMLRKLAKERLVGLLNPLPVPEWKWKHVTMDFLFGLPHTSSGYDDIWVIVDRLTKTTRFLPVKITFTLDKLTNLYVDKIVSAYGAPMSIVLQGYLKVLVEFTTNLGYQVIFQYHISSSDKWLVKMNHPDFGEYALGLCVIVQG